jgi:hypothetical protein
MDDSDLLDRFAAANALVGGEGRPDLADVLHRARRRTRRSRRVVAVAALGVLGSTAAAVLSAHGSNDRTVTVAVDSNAVRRTTPQDLELRLAPEPGADWIAIEIEGMRLSGSAGPDPAFPGDLDRPLPAGPGVLVTGASMFRAPDGAGVAVVTVHASVPIWSVQLDDGGSSPGDIVEHSSGGVTVLAYRSSDPRWAEITPALRLRWSDGADRELSFLPRLLFDPCEHRPRVDPAGPTASTVAPTADRAIAPSLAVDASSC